MNEVITMLIASLLESLVSVSVLPEIVLQSLQVDKSILIVKFHLPF